MVTFNQYLKQNTCIGMQTNVITTRVNHEGLSTFESLLDFDEKSIKALQTACKEAVPAIMADPANNIAAQAAIPGVSIPSKYILRLTEAVHAAHYYNDEISSYCDDN